MTAGLRWAVSEAPAYLEFFVGPQEDLEEKHHVWSHSGQVFGVRISLVHITESNAHGVIHKQEAAADWSYATQESQMLQSASQSPTIFWSSVSSTKATREDISVVMVCY